MLMHIKHLLARNAYSVAIAFTIFIGIISLVSFKGIPTISFRVSNFDKIVHFTLYFLLTISWFFATQQRIKKAKQKKLLIVILILYGIIIEAIQGGLTTDRQADIYDVLANSIGVFLAAAFFSKLNRWFNSI